MSWIGKGTWGKVKGPVGYGGKGGAAWLSEEEKPIHVGAEVVSLTLYRPFGNFTKCRYDNCHYRE